MAAKNKKEKKPNLNSLNNLIKKKFGFISAGLKNYSVVLTKDLSAMIRVTPKNHYLVDAEVKINTGTKVTVCGANISNYSQKDYYHFEPLNYTNEIYFNIEGVTLVDNGSFWTSLEEFIEAAAAK